MKNSISALFIATAPDRPRHVTDNRQRPNHKKKSIKKNTAFTYG